MRTSRLARHRAATATGGGGGGGVGGGEVGGGGGGGGDYLGGEHVRGSGRQSHRSSSCTAWPGLHANHKQTNMKRQLRSFSLAVTFLHFFKDKLPP